MDHYRDLRDFIDRAERFGEVRKFSGASCELEIGAITEITNELRPVPLCIFEKIDGCSSRYRVVTNLLTSEARENLVYGMEPDLPLPQAIRIWKERVRHEEAVPPRVVTDAPVLENSIEGDKIDLRELPLIRWHEKDGGGYLCSTSVTIRDPETGYLNVGSYRFKYISPTTMVCHIGSGHNGDTLRRKYWAEGKSCPITISLAQDPCVLIAAGTNVAYGASEFEYAGWLRGEPIEIIDGPTLGVPMPADAEVVIEAELLPPEDGMVPEGPFGEMSGYYGGGVHEAPIVAVRAIWERSNPIVLGAPPMPGVIRSRLGSRAVQVWNELEDLGIPNIEAVNYSWGLTIISVKQAFPGHAMRAAHGALGGTAGYHGRVIITVDEDVNVYDAEEVLWVIATRCDPETSIDIARRIWSYRIDPRLSPDKRRSGDLTGSAVIIDACRPYHWKDDYPEVTGISRELRETTIAKWKSQIQ